VGGSSLRVAHGKYALAAVLGGALRRIRAAINKWNTPVKLILSQMGSDYAVLELTELLGSVEELVRVPYCVFSTFKPGTFNPPKLGIDFDSKMLYSD
jgi:hypothetical protein